MDVSLAAPRAILATTPTRRSSSYLSKELKLHLKVASASVCVVCDQRAMCFWLHFWCGMGAFPLPPQGPRMAFLYPRGYRYVLHPNPHRSLSNSYIDCR